MNDFQEPPSRRQFLRQTGALVAAVAGVKPVTPLQAMVADLASYQSITEMIHNPIQALNRATEKLENHFGLNVRDRLPLAEVIADVARRWGEEMLPQTEKLAQQIRFLHGNPLFKDIINKYRQGVIAHCQETLRTQAAMIKKYVRGSDLDDLSHYQEELLEKIRVGQMPANVGILEGWETELNRFIFDHPNNAAWVEPWGNGIDRVARRYLQNEEVCIPGLSAKEHKMLNQVICDMYLQTLDIAGDELGQNRPHTLLDIDPARLVDLMSESSRRLIRSELKNWNYDVTPEVEAEIKRAFSKMANRALALTRPEDIPADPEEAQWYLAVEKGFSSRELKHALADDPESIAWRVNYLKGDDVRGR